MTDETGNAIVASVIGVALELVVLLLVFAVLGVVR